MEARIPPHSMEAEKSALGAALLSKDALLDIIETVKAEDFYDPNHREIFDAMLELSRRNVAVDALTVAEELSRRNSLDMVGGRIYISDLSSETPVTSNAGEYAKIIGEKAVVRNMIAAGEQISKMGFDSETEAGAMLEYAEKSIFEISQSRQKSSYTHIKDVLMENINEIDRAAKMEGGLTGMTTGFKGLDEKTAGLQKSDLIVLAARPGMGKTAFALSMALNAATRGGASVLVFSLEMSKEQLGQRLMSMESKVSMQAMKTGRLERRDWDDINAALETLSRADINIDDTAGINVLEMKSKCRRLKAESGLDLVIVDYLQLMSSEGRVESRTQEISVITRNLKLMARELDCPVIVLSQLSRKTEERGDKRPQLSDLRDSGSIEQDADIVLFLYRDDYYDESTDNSGECEVIVAKQRSGPTGTVKIAWVSKITKFVDRADGGGFIGM